MREVDAFVGAGAWRSDDPGQAQWLQGALSPLPVPGQHSVKRPLSCLGLGSRPLVAFLRTRTHPSPNRDLRTCGQEGPLDSPSVPVPAWGQLWAGDGEKACAGSRRLGWDWDRVTHCRCPQGGSHAEPGAEETGGWVRLGFVTPCQLCGSGPRTTSCPSRSHGCAGTRPPWPGRGRLPSAVPPPKKLLCRGTLHPGADSPDRPGPSWRGWGGGS